MSEEWTVDDVRRIIRDPRNRSLVGDALWERANAMVDRELIAEQSLNAVTDLAVDMTNRLVQVIGIQTPSTHWEALERKWTFIKQTDFVPTKERLAAAAVYFLHTPIVDLVNSSAASLRRWEVRPQDFLTPHGFVWFERPRTHQLGMQGFLWLTDEEEHKVMISGIDALGPRATLNAYFGDDVFDPAFLQKEQAQFGKGGFADELLPDLRFIGAAVLFMSQEILVREPNHVPRHAARRLQREHPSAAAESIAVLVLRRQHLRSGESERDSHPVDWTWRWAVRGHWRQQPVGPRRVGRRPVWVHPYIKGPEDKPFKPPPAQIFDVRR
jgi:hypothetical protein